MSEFKLQPRYGKQSVPVFKIRKAGTKHEIIDMMVKIMLEGEVSESWFTGENHQILPTETQKNTCYAIALKATFDCIENYAITLARDILSRHGHIVSATVDVEERIWAPVVVGGKPHNHVFTSGADPVKKTCHVVVKRGAEHHPDVTSGLRDIKLMKTTASGFAGYIVDQYTNLQPVGDGSKSASRIMCTLMEATWHYNTAPPMGYAATNATVIDTLIELYSGPADTGVYSKSVQETAYKMCTEALRRVPALASVHLVTPNIHHYLYNLEQFGLPNDNVVFQSTDCHTTASGRIETNVFRPAAKL